MMYSNPLSASPSDIQRKRQLAQQLLMNAQQTQPQTIGEGLGAVGDYIYAGRVSKVADEGDRDIRGKGQAILASLLGGGGQQPMPAAPQQGSSPAGVDVAPIQPPAGMGPNTMPQAAPQVQGYQPQQQQMAQAEPQAQKGQNGRFMFTDVDTERLIELSMDPNVGQTLEYIGAGSVLKMANDEIKRRWDYMTEQQKQEFQLRMQDRGFDQQTQQQTRGFEHDRGMVDLRTRSELEKTAIEQGYGSVEEMQAAGGTRQSQKIASEGDAAKAATVESARSGLGVLNDLASLYNDEGVADITGNFEQWRGSTFQSEGGNRALTKHNQIKGQAFLQAYETLKGGGPITDIEGKQATDAIQRIDRSLTEKEYKAAVADFYETVRGITVRRLVAAGVPEDQWPPLVRTPLGVAGQPQQPQQQQQPAQGGLSPEKMQRLEELRRKRDQGTLQ